MITIYKPIGISCADLINTLKETDEYKGKHMGFSGRLDEMAHGKVIILLDEETKKTKDYHNSDKVYRFRFIIGLETDTTSVLGLFQNKEHPNDLDIDLVCKTIMEYDATEFIQEYHVFSSYRLMHDNVKKPLWWWARSGHIHEIKNLPSKKVKVYGVNIKNIRDVLLDDFMAENLLNLSKVNDKFNTLRKEEVIDQWEKYHQSIRDKKINFIEFECDIRVSSGFYVRQFVKDIGKKLNLNVLVTEIERVSYE
jgi:tRNA U55 pseudouridine synthase TruB